MGHVISHKMVSLAKRLWRAFGLQGAAEVSNRDGFYTKSALILGWRSLARRGSLLSPTQGRFWRVSLYLTQGTIRIAEELRSYHHNYISLVKSMRFIFFQVNLLFELDFNRAYNVICPTFYNHCIPCLMCVKVIYSFTSKCFVCWSY